VQHAVVHFANRGEVRGIGIGRYVMMPDHVHLFVRGLHRRERHPCSPLFASSARGIVAEESGSFPYPKARDFFFTKRSNPLKISAIYDAHVPTQASNSFEFLAKAESFGNFISLVP
jgi:hypothetical protein